MESGRVWLVDNDYNIIVKWMNYIKDDKRDIFCALTSFLDSLAPKLTYKISGKEEGDVYITLTRNWNNFQELVDIIRILNKYSKENSIPLHFVEATFFHFRDEVAKGLMNINEKNNSIVFVYHRERNSSLIEESYPFS